MRMKRVIFFIGLVLLSSSVSAQVLGTNTIIPEGTCGAGVSANAILCANSADHVVSVNSNAGTLTNFPTTVYSTASYTNATTTLSNITGLSFPVSASRNYHATCRVTWQASGTTGPKYQFTGPAAPTAVMVGGTLAKTVTTASQLSAVAYATVITDAVAVTTLTNFTDIIDIGLINGVNAGTVQLQAAEQGAGTLTVQNGSFCFVQ